MLLGLVLSGQRTLVFEGPRHLEVRGGLKDECASMLWVPPRGLLLAWYLFSRPGA